MGMLDNTAAVITGASRGIGAAAARVMATEGAAVLLTARTQNQIDEVAAEINEAGGTAAAMAVDVSDFASVDAAVKHCREVFGTMDVLVNNAGVIDPIGHLSDSDPDEWMKAASINYFGIYNGVRAALPMMKAQRRGRIINISSGAAHAPLEGWAHYCSAKAAAAMLTRCAQLEAGDAGVSVVGLSPGTVATYMQEAISGSQMNPVSQLDWSAHIPPEWVGKAIAWLATDAGDVFAGEEVKLRDDDVRRKIGLID